MIKIQPQCPLCGSWNVKIGHNDWNHCHACGVWFNLETEQHQWCMFSSPE